MLGVQLTNVSTRRSRHPRFKSDILSLILSVVFLVLLSTADEVETLFVTFVFYCASRKLILSDHSSITSQ